MRAFVRYKEIGKIIVFITFAIILPVSILTFLVFMSLKLCEVISWSWVIVCIPVFVLSGWILLWWTIIPILVVIIMLIYYNETSVY